MWENPCPTCLGFPQIKPLPTWVEITKFLFPTWCRKVGEIPPAWLTEVGGVLDLVFYWSRLPILKITTYDKYKILNNKDTWIVENP